MAADMRVERRDDDAVALAQRARQPFVAPRTKSMRRDMLWLLSTSSTMSVGTVSRVTRSIVCCDAVFGDGERGRRQVRDEAAALVVDRRSRAGCR